MPTPVHIVRSTVGNIASVAALIERLGHTPVLTDSPHDITHAALLILPGVGAFGPMMAHLNALQLVGPLRQRIRDNRSTLGMCLGLQVLFEASEESPGVPGLAALPGHVRRFHHTLRVPQMGWNHVVWDHVVRDDVPGVPHRPTPIDDGHAYFANSYRLDDHAGHLTNLRAQGWRLAIAHHGGPFLAALARRTHAGTVLACQFHPELSGPWGASLIQRWIEGTLLSDSHPLAPTEAASHTASDQTHTTAVLRRIIPCLDVRDGRVVKGIQFQGLRDAGDPVERAAAYEAQGADELVILDVSATPEARANATHTVAAVRRAIGIPLTVGGGVRTLDDAHRLLDAGADKVAINTAAVRRPELITELADRFGVQCTVLACDAAQHADSPDTWEVVVTSGRERTGLDVVAWCADAQRRGAGEVLLTSWDRDGTGQGFDLPLLRAARHAVTIPIIASGGAHSADHLADALRIVDAALAATIFHDGHTTVAHVKTHIATHHAIALRTPRHSTMQPVPAEPVPDENAR